MVKHKQLLASALVIGIVGLCMIIPMRASAASSNVASQAVTQSYTALTNIQLGMIVRLVASNTSEIEPLNQASATAMQGVAVAANDAALTLSQNTTSQQIYVATNGRYTVLVSTQNGPIKDGDYITISSLDGIGMKANSTDAVVLGKAAEPFSGSDTVISSATLTTSDHAKINVSVGRIAVDISITHNPLQVVAGNNLPGYLQRASATIANKPVSTSRVYVSLAIILVTALVAGSLLYGGVRSGITAIGRNPLARQSIGKSLVQVVLTSFIILIIGLFGVYLILRL